MSLVTQAMRRRLPSGILLAQARLGSVPVSWILFRAWLQGDPVHGAALIFPGAVVQAEVTVNQGLNKTIPIRVLLSHREAKSRAAEPVPRARSFSRRLTDRKTRPSGQCP